MVLLLGAVFLFQLIGPSPRIIISKQTTYITAPLLPSGVPNYEEYVRQKLRAGVTPENNAAVLLFQALWPSELDPRDYEAIATELGLSEIPSAKDAMQSVYGEANRKRVLSWLPKPKEGDVEPDVDAIIDAALDHPWTSKQAPPLDEWVDANQKPLDLIVEASRRPRYYSPSPTFLDDRHDTLIAMLLPGPQAVRDGVRGLKMRAMRNIGENRLSEAWQDNLAMYRLSGLVAQGQTLIEQLVGMAIRGMACNATAALLSSDQLTKELATQIQHDLAAVPPFANIANCIDQMERLSTLDAIVHMKLYGFSQLGEFGTGVQASSPVDYVSVDWNVAMKKLNHAYDEVAAAMRLPPGDEREQALAIFETELADEPRQIKQPGRLVSALFSRNARSDVVGSIISALMLPAISAVSGAEDRTNSILILTKVEAALAVYRAEHGEYPKTLDDLLPGVLPKLPADPLHAKPILYRRFERGYLLYTVGRNGRDEAGSNEQMSIFEGRSEDGLPPDEAETLRDKIPKNADDYSVRLPVSPFELPKPPAP